MEICVHDGEGLSKIGVARRVPPGLGLEAGFGCEKGRSDQERRESEDSAMLSYPRHGSPRVQCSLSGVSVLWVCCVKE